MSVHIASVGRALPSHYYDQESLIAAFKAHWGSKLFNLARLEQLHRSVLVGGRHLALPIEEYGELSSFTEANDAYIRVGTDLGARAVVDAVHRAELTPQDIDHIFFVSVTGLATPSIDARLVNRLELNPRIKRTPIFGLGCVAGAAGLARTSDYLRAFPDEVAILLSVELCSLTLQRGDLSIPNLIASGLFGDGAAAVVLTGESRTGRGGPEVVATRSTFYPGTENVMAWQVTSGGFKVILSAEVPDMVRRHIRGDVDRFLADHDLILDDIQTYVCHTGGPKVLEAFQQALELPDDALKLSWDSLQQIGNLSSASVLMVLGETMEADPPQPGSYGLMLAMGPGFCSELVLLRW